MHDLIAWLTDTTVGPFTVADAAGFVTGAACVWLVVRNHVANWPVGLANNAFFLILFVDARLYADAGLQIVYFVLGVGGWYWWLRGGNAKTELPISRVPRREVLACVVAAVAGFVILTLVLRAVDGALPPVDAATTSASLVAQYLLTRRRLENWWVWIAVDVIYVPLYFARDLPLTAVLYVIFLGLCVTGLRQWKKLMADPTADAESAMAATGGTVATTNGAAADRAITGATISTAPTGGAR